MENAFIAYEEYKKNERILNSAGLVPLPCNLNFHNHYQEVVPGVIEEITAYDTLGNKITTWGAPSQNNTRVTTYVDFGVHMANYGEYKATAAKDNKNITNCRNCGAPLRSCTCGYCGTKY